MVIYIENKHVTHLESILRHALSDTGNLDEENAAGRAALSSIEQQKQQAPYRLWRRAHSTQEAHS